MAEPRPRATGARFRGVLLDWRGTLAVASTYRTWVGTALERAGRDAAPSSIDSVLSLLRSAEHSIIESSVIDTDSALHRDVYYSWFAEAGVDQDLADALYAVESDASENPFAEDTGPLLSTLHEAGIRIGVLSDIHFDLRPAFAQHRNHDGTRWSDLIDAWMLSFELGVAKPNSGIFRIALERLDLTAGDVLMVGDRGGWDGAAVSLGITTLLLPPLRAVDDLRLQRVLDLVLSSQARRVDPQTRPESAIRQPQGSGRRIR